MHEYVRTRIGRNADYHAAVAEHYTNLLQAKKEQVDGNGGSRERATLTDTHEMPLIGTSVEDLEKLIEMHVGAAKDLHALLATDAPHSILSERQNPPVVRNTGPVGRKGMPMRNGSPRIH
jgi:hypothetical protein